MMVTIQEAELILLQRIQEKDSSALAELMDLYGAALNGVVQRILTNPEEVEEVMQDSFVKIWNHSLTYDPAKGRLFTWMLNIARNQALDRLKSKHNKNQSKIHSIDNVVNQVDVEHKHQMSVDHIGVQQLMNKLEGDQLNLIQKVYFEGYTQQELSDELKIPLGTVKTKIRTAIIELRKYFIDK